MKKFTPILKSLALGLLLATLGFMFLVRVVNVDDDFAGVAFFVLWPMLSYGLWTIMGREKVISKKRRLNC